MGGIPQRRRSWLIAALALVLAAAAVYLVSRPSRTTAGPAPASALTRSTPSAVTAEAPSPSATAPAPPSRSAPPTATARPTAKARPAAEADHVFVVPTGTPGRAAATVESAPRRCAQWHGAASDEHAAALLLAARQNEGGAEVPPPGLVRAYRLAITTACAGPGRADDNVADVARVVYETDRDRWGI
jgi:hypothetical protein